MTTGNKQNVITNDSRRSELPTSVHQDAIVRGRMDFAAVRRREEAELERLIAANRKPRRPWSHLGAGPARENPHLL